MTETTVKRFVRPTANHLSVASKIRRLAKHGQYGHSRSPRTFHMGEGGCCYYWDNVSVMVTDIDGKDKFMYLFDSQVDWDYACKVLNRYKRFVHFVTEVQPQWTKVHDVFYADNSTAVVEVDKDGVTRERMTGAPGGDRCF